RTGRVRAERTRFPDQPDLREHEAQGPGRGDPGQRVSTMSFKQSVEIAGSAMAAQTVRMNTIASNLANADTAGTADSAYVARKPDRKSTRLNSSHVKISYAV